MFCRLLLATHIEDWFASCRTLRRGLHCPSTLRGAMCYAPLLLLVQVSSILWYHVLASSSSTFLKLFIVASIVAKSCRPSLNLDAIFAGAQTITRFVIKLAIGIDFGWLFFVGK